MNPRTVILAWLAVPLAVLAAVLVEAWLVPQPANRFADADVALIGSSLVAHALPETSQTPDGRAIRRVGIASPDEYQLLMVLDEAIAAKVPIILIEAAPWISDFRFDAEKDCRMRGAGLRQAVHQPQVALVDRLRHLFGAKTSLEGMGEPAALDQPQSLDPAFMDTFYPIKIHPPCLERDLGAALARAKAQGSRVVLAVMPRSPAGEARLGAAQSAELAAAAQTLARKFDLALFDARGPWPNSLFSDHAHLNRAGRALYEGQLRAWLGARP